MEEIIRKSSIIILLTILLSMVYSHSWAQADSVKQENVYVFSNEAYYLAKIIEPLGKKTKIKILEPNAKKEIRTVKSYYVFNIRKPDNEFIRESLRFRIADDLLAEDVIVRGTVLGFNNSHFLLEYRYNNKHKIAAKHKNEIVQKDLK